MNGERGASMIEFTIVFTLILLPLVMGVLEFAQLTVARQNLQYALFETVRAAEASSEEPRVEFLRWRVARGLLPLLSHGEDAGPMALTPAATLAARPDLLTISYRSLGTTTVDTAVKFDTWELTVTWCRELFFAPIKQLLPALLRLSSSSLFDQACFLRDSLALKSRAYVLRPSASTS